MKLFLETAFQNWNSPKPSYLTLIGDANYDYKHYRFINDGVIGGGNFVPSYGDPVSDNWYAVWSDSSIDIPQLMVGRIPINNATELDYYLSKITNNINSSYSEFNKRFLFFSGGSANNQSELDQLRGENNSIITGLIKPKPISGEYTHFYKTVSPQSDLGPYTQDQIQNEISKGALLISYIGHSGTATWDNGINETTQLENSVNGNPLITDFGCSTNKFAEPDIVCFGERFLLNSNGQALDYIGNSSLGFTNTATTVPYLFYQSLINDSLHIVGNAHLNAKINMFKQYGSSNVFNVFALTNTILGDPAIQIKLPNKPNLEIGATDLITADNYIDEGRDSTLMKIVIHNFGISLNDSVLISVSHTLENKKIEEKNIYIPFPDYIDTLDVWLKVNLLPGMHTVDVTIDPYNKIDEIYKTDNSAQTNFFVSSNAVRDLLSNVIENPSLNLMKILNPSLYSKNQFNIISEISTDPTFQTYNQLLTPSQPFITKIILPQLNQNKRYWIRYKLNDSLSSFSQPKSFLNSEGSKFYLADSLSLTNQIFNNLNYLDNALKLSTKSEKISLLSAGTFSGATCTISLNGKNLLPNSYFTGMGIVVFNPNTLVVDTSESYNLFNQPVVMQQLVTLINSIDTGKIVAMGVSDDAANNITSNLKNAIKTLGSTKIDSLRFQGSWALIGRKGANPGDVIEQVKGPYNGSILIDSTFIIPNSTGEFITNSIGPAIKWKSINLINTTPSDSKINFKILGIKNDSSVDTLQVFNSIDSTASLSNIDANVYPRLKVLANFNSSTDGISPELKKVSVDYIQPPELGLNYQTVSISADTVYQGDSTKLFFSIFNVGESEADSFKVDVYLNRSDKTQKLLFDTLVVKLDTMSKVSFELGYKSNFYDGYGPLSFSIQVDNDQRIPEMYKDNNFYNESFYVVKDTITLVKTANISYTFDGNNIFDGDYVSSNPEILFKLNYGFQYPFRDTTKVNIILDGQKIYYAGMDSIVYDTINRQVLYKIRPKLKDGEHYLTINGNDLVNQASDLQKTFIVSNELKILDLYNYPNPFNLSTYFTFNLTQIPEDMKIKIYTVAGRLIKEINIPPSVLRNNFNRIFWDGRDEDGDLLANGVYLYKIIAKLADKTYSDIQKLAIVR
ncbi:MAG: C25 family cysteine peptidase [Bacteroidetes bacterium]|nr:C25 family cysteine peptidase [Bacteroidota bacterium]